MNRNSMVYKVFIGALVLGLGLFVWGVVKRGNFFESLRIPDLFTVRRDPSATAGTLKLTPRWSRTFYLDAMGGENMKWTPKQTGIQGLIEVNGRDIHSLQPGGPDDPPYTITNTVVTIRFKVTSVEKADLVYYVRRGEIPENWYNLAVLASR